MEDNRKWYGSEVSKTFAEKFKVYLQEQELEYEASEAGRLIHFEVYANEEELKTTNAWISKHL